jgi:protein TonB
MRGILVTASDRTLAMPAEVMRIGAWPAVDIGRAARRWLPALLASVCANLLLLYLFPVLLQARAVAPETLPIRVTLSPAPVTVEQPIAPPPKPQPPRVKPQPAPVTLPSPPEPVPQSAPVMEPEAQTMPAVEPLIAGPSPSAPEPVTEPEPLPKPQPLYKLTRLPELIAQRKPAYPESERAGGREDEVLAEVFIDATGRVLDVAIIKSAGRAFDQAVTTALRESRFTPGYIGDEAVAVQFQIPFRFQLD